MNARRKPKELESVEDFERALSEEISVSEDFDLPLSVLVSRMEGGWSPEATRRVLDSLRTADLIARPQPDEISIALPNTAPADARKVEARLRKAVPEAAFGLTERKKGDALEDILERARRGVVNP